jgi:hypothetical protein
MEAWHFVGGTLRDGSPIPPDGETLALEGPIIPCKWGLHASVRLIDALHHAPGNTLCRVRLGGEIVEREDKVAASERTILWRIDADPVLREFARWCALQVTNLWAAPDVVRRWLETGDETLRDAACASAQDAGWAAASAAACASTRTAASAAVRDAAWAAASAAASASARDAAWAAANAAAWAADRAANAAAWDAAWDAQNDKLTEMVLAAHDKQTQQTRLPL